MQTDIRGRGVVVGQDDGDPIFEIRLGALIPAEIWEMGIEAVRVGKRVLRNPTPDETVQSEGGALDEHFAFGNECTVWIADGIRWVEMTHEWRDEGFHTYNVLEWTILPRPQPARPPIPG